MVKNYVTQKCGEIIGPDHGAYIQFDPKATVRKGTGSTLQRRNVVKHMLQFTEDYNSPRTQQSTGALTMCGKSAIQPNMEFEGEYVSLFFYIDYRVPNGTEADKYNFPEVNFKLDVTSFDYDCTTSIAGQTMKCLHSRRCIDESLRCDFTSSNCASEAFPLDRSDRTKAPPGNCGQFDIPRNAILTWQTGSRFLQVDGFSDDGYSEMSSRVESPISSHGFSSRNTTARETSPRRIKPKLQTASDSTSRTTIMSRKNVEKLSDQIMGHIQFDPKATVRKGVIKIPEYLKGSIFECLIVVRGVPAARKTRYFCSLARVPLFKKKCGKTYVTIYRGLQQSSDTQSTGALTMCGKSAIQPNMEFEESMCLFFYIDYRVPNGTEADKYNFPEVNFKLDVTSFDDCITSIAGQTMKCLHSRRCIDESLRCDFFTSSNCASEAFPLDRSDRTKAPPGNCGQFDYVTQKCGEIIGPDHGAYIQFDPKATVRKGVIKIPEYLKGSIFECLIVVRGVPAARKTRYISVHWRDFHIRHSDLDGFHSSKKKCGKTYVTIYRGLQQSSDTQSTGALTMCGKSAIQPNMEFEGEYVSLFFYIDYRVPNGTEADKYNFPEVNFKLDVTSFDYDCITSIAGQTMKCLHSRRCIDESLRCDFFTSSNCASEAFPLDRSDRTKAPPGNCGQFGTYK
ncbi:hypothetical protein KUTeg_019216 [Tegillarca granosa]|uniref:CUB domain-containing protein n=1 Tax=Tegillarca granosa TaxID=220873 RepID=A0ABQ9EHC0_TEGGR|nr:hypothetical protein KUTeg_019216 [Tegillarca granosa]